MERIELKLAQGEVHVYLDHHEMIPWACAECGAPAKWYDPPPERREFAERRHRKLQTARAWARKETGMALLS